MKKLLIFFVLIAAYITSPLVISAQDATQTNKDAQIPVDPNVKKGTFENGLTYYIRSNEKPEDMVELRLVVNAGSILEDEDQRGLAHFLEHMNFNGTKNFKKNELVDYLQSIGVEFGADLNAYTSFGRTVYILPIPTDDPETLEKGFTVLEDWAHGTLLEPEMVDGERGVVLEEYRLGLGAGERMREQYLPIILKGSRYPDRLPIGTKESIQNFEDESLRRFYNDWYRPGLMAVIAVGDLDTDTLYQKIEHHFAGIPTRENPRQREIYSIPNHKETYVAVATDKEAPFSQVQLTYQDEGEREVAKTIGDYRHSLVENLFSEMINNRLEELQNSAEPPFVFASSNHGRYWAPGKEAYQSFAITDKKDQLKALRALLITNKKVKEYGFEPVELERAKKEFLASLENQYKGRKTRESASYVNGYISNYLVENSIPGIEWEYEQAQQLVPAIKLEEVSRLIDEYLHEDNRTVLLTGPVSEQADKVTEQKVRNVLDEVGTQKVAAYKAKEVRENLMQDPPEAGSITQSSINDELGTTTLTLSNGAAVTYKKTDFKENQILFRAFSYGGSSLFSDEVYREMALADNGLTEAGVAGLSKTDLKNVLTGKNVSVSPSIGSLTEGMRGNSTPQDLETMFQLINLYFTSLNKDNEAFQSFISRQKGLYGNLLSNPQFYFSSELNKYVYGSNNPRYIGFPTPRMLEKANYDLAYKKYQERFANAGDFKFYFVGNIPVDAFKEYTEKYLAGLPASSNREEYKVLPYRPLSGSHNKVIYKGEAPQSTVRIIYNGETAYSPNENFYMESLGDILTIKLVEILREKESGVYGVGASGGLAKIPYGSFSFSISFPCGPDNAQKLIKSALAEVQKIIENGPTDKDLKKIKETQLLSYKENMKKNDFWLSNLVNDEIRKMDKTAFLNFKSKVDALTKADIQKVAQKYLSEGHITGILYPEGYELSEQ